MAYRRTGLQQCESATRPQCGLCATERVREPQVSGITWMSQRNPAIPQSERNPPYDRGSVCRFLARHLQQHGSAVGRCNAMLCAVRSLERPNLAEIQRRVHLVSQLAHGHAARGRAKWTRIRVSMAYFLQAGSGIVSACRSKQHILH